VQMSHSSPALWLHDRRYDLTCFVVVPVTLWLLFNGLASVMGPNGPLTIYTAQALIFGLPHNWVTWLLIMPKDSRSYYQQGTLMVPAVLTALFLAPVFLFYGTPMFAWAVTLGVILAYFHIVRQHQGILHVCDGRYVQATGDATIRTFSPELRRLVGSVAASAAAWKLVGGPLMLGIVGAAMQFQIWPIPLAVPILCTAAALYYAARTGFGLFKRHRAGQPFPTVHALVAGAAMANVTAAALVPNAQLNLTMALVASYHNIQYFMFCYTHHHLRAVADPVPSDMFSRWARDRQYVKWFGLPVLLGVGFGLAISKLPPYWTAGLGYWFMTSHYFVDGNIWRRKFYPLMGRFGSGRVATSIPTLGQPPPGTFAPVRIDTGRSA
jgi:hypothetical protein